MKLARILAKRSGETPSVNLPVQPAVLAPQTTISWSPALAVVFVILLYYATQIIGGLLISIYPAMQHWSQAAATDWLNNSIWAQFSYVVVAEGLTVAGLYAFLRRRKTSFAAIGLHRPRWKDPAWALAVVPVYYLTYLIVVAVFHALVPALNINQQQQLGFNHVTSGINLVVAFVSLVVLPPIVEELLVRGFLYSSLRKRFKIMPAAIITSILFAAGHLEAGSGAPLLWIAAIDTFILSLFLVYLREKTGSLWASMTLHALKNFVAFTALYLVS